MICPCMYSCRICIVGEEYLEVGELPYEVMIKYRQRMKVKKRIGKRTIKKRNRKECRVLHTRLALG